LAGGEIEWVFSRGNRAREQRAGSLVEWAIVPGKTGVGKAKMTVPGRCGPGAQLREHDGWKAGPGRNRNATLDCAW